MSSRKSVTLADAEWEFAKTIAARIGCSESEVVQLGFRFGSAGLIEYCDRISPKTDSQEKSAVLLQSVLVRLLSGAEVPDKELELAGYYAGLSPEDMHKLKSCLLEGKDESRSKVAAP